MTLDINNCYLGDCLELMKDIPDKSIDMILCDLPYGTTACKWDTIIPFEPLWEQYKRIIKDNRAIVLTASQPFTTDLINSAREIFKYELIWDKTVGCDFLNSKNKPMKSHENILIFSKGTTANCSPNKMLYIPQMGRGKPYATQHKSDPRAGVFAKGNRTPFNPDYISRSEGGRYPLSIIKFARSNYKSSHPTQKPVPLFEYLINTYTNEGDLVLDNCMGSGTTAIACINTDRDYICMEKDEGYFEKAKIRIGEAQRQKRLS